VNKIKNKYYKNKRDKQHLFKLLFTFIRAQQMLLPNHLYHDAPNPFMLYGFKYKTMAHWIVVQSHARRGSPFKHFFDMPVTELPKIYKVNKEVLEEGLDAMLPDIKPQVYRYAHSHPILGIGTTRFRLKFNDNEFGKNAYGQCISAVLKRRGALK
jgi:hypothetical protein